MVFGVGSLPRLPAFALPWEMFDFFGILRLFLFIQIYDMFYFLGYSQIVTSFEVAMETFLKLVALVVGMFVFVIIGTLLCALPVMLLWNYLMPGLFGLSTISFWQALGLSALCGLLFKSSSVSSKS
jgi:hypothetical protein